MREGSARNLVRMSEGGREREEGKKGEFEGGRKEEREGGRECWREEEREREWDGGREWGKKNGMEGEGALEELRKEKRARP